MSVCASRCKKSLLDYVWTVSPRAPLIGPFSCPYFALIGLACLGFRVRRIVLHLYAPSPYMIASSPTPCLPLYRDALLFMLTGLPCLSYCPPLRFSTPQLFGPSFQNANPSVLLRLWLPRASFFNYTTTSVSPLSISVFGPSARNAPVLRLPCPNPCTPIQSSVCALSSCSISAASHPLLFPLLWLWKAFSRSY